MSITMLTDAELAEAKELGLTIVEYLTALKFDIKPARYAAQKASAADDAAAWEAHIKQFGAKIEENTP